jgi:hypothetical protein
VRGRRRAIRTVLASTVLVFACAPFVNAQGKGNGNAHKSSPPSSSPLPNAGPGGPTASGAAPLAWIDDASVLTPGTMALTISTMRWSGADLSQVDFPIVDMSVGLTPRVQVGASIPHIVGSTDGTGPVGGIGTAYISGKIAVVRGTSSGVKLAVTPTIEILNEGAVAALTPADGRTQFGLPVSLEIARGQGRVFASTGFFTGGVWFAGGGASVRVSRRTAIALSLSRAWVSDAVTGLSHDRGEISGSASYLVRPQMAVFGSLGQTMATADADGAGTTVSGGVTFLLTPAWR